MQQLKLFLIMGIFSTWFGCKPDKNSNAADVTLKETSKPVTNINPTKDQAERRARSEAYCAKYEIPVYKNPNSLFVEPEEKVSIRSKDEIVDRAIALCYIELKSEGAPENMLADFDKRYNVMSKLTAEEKAFALNNKPGKQEMADANWRAESFHVMLWALGFIDSLKHPAAVCVVAEDVPHLFSRTEEEFRKAAKLRSKIEILDQADLILRLDWACMNAKIKNLPAPAGLNTSVVYERHYSLNWLTKYMNQEWDDVKTDT